MRTFAKSISLLLLVAPGSGCASDAGPNEGQPTATTTQPVYYGSGRPGDSDNSTCGPHSAVGELAWPGRTCSGTLVRNNIVVTAQHCAVPVGARFSFPGTGNGTSFGVTKVSAAPGYQPKRYTSIDLVSPNDIAVVQLDKAVPRHMAEPLWLLIDSPETYGLSLWTYNNPSYNPPEMVGYGGTQHYDSDAGQGMRRAVPAAGLQWGNDYCDSSPFELHCWGYPFWKFTDDLDSSFYNYMAGNDSGGALIGYVTGMKYLSVFSSSYSYNGSSPVLLGVLSGYWQDSFAGGLSTDEGGMAAATFNISPALRDFFLRNVYNIPEAPYSSISGPAVADMAIYGTDWGVTIDDRAAVYSPSGGWGAIGSNPVGWLGCPWGNSTPTTLVPGVVQHNMGTVFGTDIVVGNVWANSDLSVHDRDHVNGLARAEGNISVITQATVTNSMAHTRINMPSLNVTGMAIPSGTQCQSIALEPDASLTARTPADCVYIPDISVKTNAVLTFPCSSTAYHVGNLTTEPNGALRFTTSAACTNAKVYIHGRLTLKGTMSSGIDPVASPVSNVLLVVTSSSAEIESGFNGVLIVPNGLIHAVPGQKHYGAFYGKHVYLEQDSRFYHRPFNAALPLQ